MEQDVNTIQYLADLIAFPEKVTQEDAAVLKDIAKQYPYFQPVRLLIAKAGMHNADLATAALYNNGKLLYHMLHAPDRLLNNDFNLIHYSEQEQIENEPDALDEIAIDEVAELSEDALPAEEDEVYDEIGEVDFNSYPASNYIHQPHPDENPQTEKDTVENDLVLENIVSTDFFAFQDNFRVEPASDDVQERIPQIEEYSEQAALEQEDNVVSKYDDDKLPYTFLWWLAKTRKEHQQIFQPYASPKRNNQTGTEVSNRPNELQQQYVEHIFHMQGPFNEEDNIIGAFKHQKKGNEIIESFIKNEPQISPPNPEQINNENKAKKSAEDHNDLVSETLAKIYIEQMLYDKAIETYEKLSLMFPEKSRYFADLIQSIEKKI